MNFLIITSSYPATPQDPSGTAGLFVRQFALELVELGHTVIIQPVARKPHYHSDPGVLVVPTAWRGGDRELASMNFANPLNWFLFFLLFISGIRSTRQINKQHSIDRMLCMWAVPSGVFGLAGKLNTQIPYDVWALGSDIWKIRKIPWLGKVMLGWIMQGAAVVYADGYQLCREVTELTSIPCEFLATSRKLPQPQQKVVFQEDMQVRHFLFVGRYHPNKGPDLLLEAIALLPDEVKKKIRVHMFGLGPMEAELHRRTDELNLSRYVYLSGPIQAQELSNYLDSVSFLVIPSRIESIPVVFSDAIQRGVPVVATPVGDLPQVIAEFGCGIIADDVSVEALSSALARAAAADRTAYEDATALASARFDIKATVARWLDNTSG
jgi:glycosyltransferase involved in cell wall biosynthesis